ncbi:MAG: GNAT family N-acetyltransferase [Planctomycetota bacterium]
MTPPDDLVLRRLATVEELRACEDLQMEVWSYTEREVVPKNELLAAVRSGGSLIGAYDAATLVAFAYGMAGWDGHAPYLSSRLVAVREAFRGHGLGERLKAAQREHCLELGYPKIKWTQDALQAANARLNFRKLGATCRSYVVDYYGTTSSPLHGSLPTDRLELDWDLHSDRVKRRLGLEKGVDPAAVVAGHEGVHALLDGSLDSPPRPVAGDPPPAGAMRLSVAVPPSLAACLAHDKALGLAWRLATRESFERAFREGYQIVDFVSSRPGEPNAFARYILARVPEPSA